MKHCVYIDDNGMFYKATEPKMASHAKRSLVTADFLAVLPNDGTPMHLLDIETAVSALKNSHGKEG